MLFKKEHFEYKRIPRFKATENKNIREINTSEEKATVTIKILKKTLSQLNLSG